MSTQISPQMRIVALAGVLLILLAGAALVLLRKHAPTVPVTTPPATHTATTPGTQHHSTSPPPPHVRVVKPKVDSRFPASVRVALERHPVVVVETYDPQVREDLLALAEARAGAAAAHVAFVPVSLVDDAVAGPLTALLPTGQLLPAPGFLVYNWPGKVVYRFDGYLDRDAVTQAVKDAK